MAKPIVAARATLAMDGAMDISARRALKHSPAWRIKCVAYSVCAVVVLYVAARSSTHVLRRARVKSVIDDHDEDENVDAEFDVKVVKPHIENQVDRQGNERHAPDTSPHTVTPTYQVIHASDSTADSITGTENCDDHTACDTNHASIVSTWRKFLWSVLGIQDGTDGGVYEVKGNDDDALFSTIHRPCAAGQGSLHRLHRVHAPSNITEDYEAHRRVQQTLWSDDTDEDSSNITENNNRINDNVKASITAAESAHAHKSELLNRAALSRYDRRMAAEPTSADIVSRTRAIGTVRALLKEFHPNFFLENENDSEDPTDSDTTDVSLNYQIATEMEMDARDELVGLFEDDYPEDEEEDDTRDEHDDAENTSSSAAHYAGNTRLARHRDAGAVRRSGGADDAHARVVPRSREGQQQRRIVAELQSMMEYLDISNEREKLRLRRLARHMTEQEQQLEGIEDSVGNVRTAYERQHQGGRRRSVLDIDVTSSNDVGFAYNELYHTLMQLKQQEQEHRGDIDNGTHQEDLVNALRAQQQQRHVDKDIHDIMPDPLYRLGESRPMNDLAGEMIAHSSVAIAAALTERAFGSGAENVAQHKTVTAMRNSPVTSRSTISVNADGHTAITDSDMARRMTMMGGSVAAERSASHRADLALQRIEREGDREEDEWIDDDDTEDDENDNEVEGSVNNIQSTDNAAGAATLVRPSAAILPEFREDAWTVQEKTQFEAQLLARLEELAHEWGITDVMASREVQALAEERRARHARQSHVPATHPMEGGDVRQVEDTNHSDENEEWMDVESDNEWLEHDSAEDEHVDER